METAPSLDPQPSPNTFIIRPQATISRIILPILARATIMGDRIIYLLLMHGQALINTDIKTTTIIGRARIIQEFQATMKNLIIQVDGVAHSITIRANNTLDGQANLINGQVHITNQIGRAHTTITNHLGQTVLITIGQVPIRHLALTLIMVKAITINLKRNSPLMLSMTILSVVLRNTKKTIRMVMLWPRKDRRMSLSAWGEIRL